MNQFRNLILTNPLRVCALVVLLTACGRHAPPAAMPDDSIAPAQPNAAAAPTSDHAHLSAVTSAASTVPAVSAPAAKGPFADLDWTDLLPKNDPNAGFPTNVLIDHTGNIRMPQRGSFNTVHAMSGKQVRIPGYIVPLQSDDAGRMKEFFFVPFYGACIHVPPPPPNQMVYAKLTHPIKTPDIYTAMSLTGTLRTSKFDNDLASAAYSMNDAALSVYEPPEPTDND